MTHICFLIDGHRFYVILSKASSFNNLVLKCSLERNFQFLLAAIGNAMFSKTFEELSIFSHCEDYSYF